MQVAETARIRWNRNRQLVLRRDDFLQVCPALEAEVDELIHIPQEKHKNSLNKAPFRIISKYS